MASRKEKRAKRPPPPIQPQQSGLRIRPRYIILFFILAIFVLGGVYLSQMTMLNTIAEDKAVLQSQLDELSVEAERLERMLEYMQTDEYLRQYAREKLGYVYPSDIKFYDDASATTQPVITPAPEATPTPAPRATVQPTVTPAQTATDTPPIPDDVDIAIIE